MSDNPSYSLVLSDQEVDRYRFMAKLARDLEADWWTRAGIVEGAAVADVGCGPGLVLLELAEIVGPRGRAVGVDRDPGALEVARRLADERGLAQVEVRQGLAWATGLEPAAFDVVNIRHVLAHNTLTHVREILAHARTLLRGAGTLFLVDVDVTAFRIDPPDEVLDELSERYAAHLRDTDRLPDIGPRLGSLVRAAGFELVERLPRLNQVPAGALATIRPPSWAAREAMRSTGHANDTDIERWDAALTRFAASALEDQATMYFPQYTVIARRP